MRTTTFLPLFGWVLTAIACGDPATPTPTGDSSVQDTRTNDATTQDVATQDTRMDTATGDVAVNDTTVRDSATTDSATADGAVVDGTAGDAAVAATWANVHTAFRTYCVNCHESANGSGGHGMAQASITDAYNSARSDVSVNGNAPQACRNGNRGRCAAIRVRDGSMPADTTLITSEQRAALVDLLDRWNAAGQPGPN